MSTTIQKENADFKVRGPRRAPDGCGYSSYIFIFLWKRHFCDEPANNEKKASTGRGEAFDGGCVRHHHKVGIVLFVYSPVPTALDG